jgi:hypothetical protein
MVSFEVEPSGALLFEAILGCARDFSVLPGLVDAADPTGVVPVRMLAPGEATSLGRELDHVPSLVEIARWVEAGYADRFGVACTPRTLRDSELPPVDAEAWLGGRRLRPPLDRRGTVATQLGTLDAHFSVRDGRLTDALLAGDFIASSGAVGELETALRGCRADPGAIDTVVRAVFANPAHFMLGVGPLATIAEAFGRGLGS